MWTNRHLFPHTNNCSENLMLALFICIYEIYRKVFRSGGVLFFYQMSVKEPLLGFPRPLPKILPKPNFLGAPQKGLAVCSLGTKENFKAEGHAHIKKQALHYLSLLLQTAVVEQISTATAGNCSYSPVASTMPFWAGPHQGMNAQSSPNQGSSAWHASELSGSGSKARTKHCPETATGLSRRTLSSLSSS